MKKKNGFTLIELLAVIVILAIIALIAIPLVLKYIEQSSKNAFKDSAYHIISAGELYYGNLILKEEKILENKIISFPDENNIISIKGEQPKSGKMSIKPDGKIAIAISNGKYCITKNYAEDKISIKEEDGDCSLPKIPNSKVVIAPEGSNYDCLTSSNKTCDVGTYLTIQVNDTQSYNFYVLADDGENLTLLMEKNLVESVAYNPLDTLLARIDTETQDWSNIKINPYENNTLKGEDSDGTDRELPNAKARLLTYGEATNILNCSSLRGSCKSWAFNYTSSCTSYGCEIAGSSGGYWLSDYYGYSAGSFYARCVFNYGSIGKSAYQKDDKGMRPVIKVAKFIEQ